MEITQGLHRAIQIRGAGTATICHDRRRIWRDLGDRVARLGAAFQGLGLKPGERIAVLSMNSDRFIECLYAIPWAGCIMVPLNFRLGAEELRHILADCEPAAVLVEAQFLDLLHEIAAAAPGLGPVVQFDGDVDGDGAGANLDYEDLIAAHRPVADSRRGGDDLLAIFYTGGTTGLPKGVMLSHDNVVHFALSFLSCEKMDQSLVHLHVAPMFHTSCIGVFFTTLAAGTHVAMPRFEPESALEAIEEHGVTHCLSVPVMVERMLFHPRAKSTDLSSLRFMGYGGSPMPAAILERVREAYPAIQFAQGYGMTEAPGAGYLGPEFHNRESVENGRIGSAGRATPTCEIAIADEEGRHLPAGETGEILIRGPIVMQGYWNQPELTAEALRDGWMHTGDAGHMDGAGFVFITDRIKDMIISGGENVYSTEVENVLYRHPSVQRCAVIGIPHDDWGEAVHAVIELKPGAEADEAAIIEHCRSRLGGYKCPRSVEFSARPLPLSAAGKVLKAKIRAPYWDRRGQKI